MAHHSVAVFCIWQTSNRVSLVVAVCVGYCKSIAYVAVLCAVKLHTESEDKHVEEVHPYCTAELFPAAKAEWQHYHDLRRNIRVKHPLLDHSFMRDTLPVANRGRMHCVYADFTETLARVKVKLHLRARAGTLQIIVLCHFCGRASLLWFNARRPVSARLNRR